MADQTSTIKTIVELDASQAAEEVIKLQSAAADSTKEIEERLEAKNKQAELQNAISQKTIKQQAKEVKALKDLGSEQKDIDKATDKLNKTKLKALKTNLNNERAINKLEQAQAKQSKTELVASDSLHALRGQLSKLNKEYDRAAASSRDKLAPAIVELTEEIKKAEEETLRFYRNVGNYPTVMERAKEGVGALDDATGGFGKSLLALAANPIVLTITAITAGLAFLYDQFKDNQEVVDFFAKSAAALDIVMQDLFQFIISGSKSISKVFKSIFDDPLGSIKSIGDAIKDNLVNRFNAFIDTMGHVGKAFKKLIDLDFEGALDEAGEAGKSYVDVLTGVEGTVDKVVDGTKDLIEGVIEYTDEVSKNSTAIAENAKSLKLLELEQTRIRESSDRNAELDRQIRDDIRKGIDERISANQRLATTLNKQEALEKKTVTDRLAALQLEQQELGYKQDRYEEIFSLQTELIAIEAQQAGFRAEQLTNEAALEKEKLELKGFQTIAELEEHQRRLAANEEYGALEIEAARARGEETTQLQLELLEQQRVNELAADELLQEEKAAIELKYKLAKEAVLEEERLLAEEEKVLAQEKEEELLEAKIEKLKAEGKLFYDIELELAAKRYQFQIDNEKLTADDKLKINKEYLKKRSSIERIAEKSKKKMLKDSIISEVSGIAEVFGFRKEAAVAEQIIAAPKAIGESFKMAAATYAPPISLAMGAVGAAGIVIPIVAGLNEIKNTRFSGASKAKGKGSSGGSGGGGSVNIPSAGSSGSQGPAEALLSDISSQNAVRVAEDGSLGSQAGADAANNISGLHGANVVFSEDKYGSFKRQVQFKEDNSTF